MNILTIYASILEIRLLEHSRLANSGPTYTVIGPITLLQCNGAYNCIYVVPETNFQADSLTLQIVALPMKDNHVLSKTPEALAVLETVPTQQVWEELDR